MKSVVVVTGPELQEAVLLLLGSRPSMHGRFVGGVHLVADSGELRADLRIRANVVLFDTQKAAAEYGRENDPKVLAADEAVTEGAK